MQLLEETASKVTNFTGFLQEVFQPSTDAVTLEHAARSLGQLVRMGGPLTTDTVETEVRTPVHLQHQDMRQLLQRAAWAAGFFLLSSSDLRKQHEGSAGLRVRLHSWQAYI